MSSGFLITCLLVNRLSALTFHTNKETSLALSFQCDQEIILFNYLKCSFQWGEKDQTQPILQVDSIPGLEGKKENYFAAKEQSPPSSRIWSKCLRDKMKYSRNLLNLKSYFYFYFVHSPTLMPKEETIQWSITLC